GFTERSEQLAADPAGAEGFANNLKFMFADPDNEEALKLSAVDSFGMIGDAVLDGQKARIDAEMEYRQNAISEEYDAELESYRALKENGIYTDEQYNAKVHELDKKKQAKEEVIKKRAFDQQKKMDIEQVLMNAATAALKLWAQAGAVAPAIQIALAAQTATQLGIIAARKYPKFAAGGIVPSGQETMNGYDNTLIAAHPGEVVLTEQQQSALGGSDTFRRIGVPGFADGGVVPPQQSLITSGEIAALMNNVKVINVATETTDVSTKVNNLQMSYEL
ncbi:MAG: hypothetical protein U9Q83_04785, partial [Bacteroidota bacterium]|nr:hypothetical protein [Bacteroidota bacterium]